MQNQMKKDYCIYDCTLTTKLKVDKTSKIVRVKAYLEGTDPKAHSLWDVERACATSICNQLQISKSEIEKAELIQYDFFGWTTI